MGTMELLSTVDLVRQLSSAILKYGSSLKFFLLTTDSIKNNLKCFIRSSFKKVFEKFELPFFPLPCQIKLTLFLNLKKMYLIVVLCNMVLFILLASFTRWSWEELYIPIYIFMVRLKMSQTDLQSNTVIININNIFIF